MVSDRLRDLLCSLCRGDFVIVGDLMKSITLLFYKAAEGALEVRDSMWWLIKQHHSVCRQPVPCASVTCLSVTGNP